MMFHIMASKHNVVYSKDWWLVKDFVVINFSEYFKPTREKSYSKLWKEQNLRKVAESLYIFRTKPEEVELYAKMMQLSFSDNCVHRYNIEILNLFDPE